jgi:prepilin-type processing-associated H-X9-DG protein
MWSPDAQENPSKMMMVGESAYRGYGRPVFMAYPKYDAWSLTPLDMTVPHLEYCAHNGGNNVCYMDGHAKWVGLADFLVDFNWNDPNSGWGHW